MRLQDIMNTRILSVTPQTGIKEAWNLMKLHQIHHLVVMDQRQLVGILSERDLIQCDPDEKYYTGQAKNRPVSEVMSSKVIQAKPETTLREAANLLRGESIGCLPIVGAKDRLAGIVTITDLLELMGRGNEKLIPDEDRQTIRNLPPGVKMGIH